MKKLFKKKSSKAVRRRTALANKTMLSIEALEKRVLLAADFGADFQAVSSGDEIWIEARGTQFQDRFTVVEVDHKIKIKIDFEIDAKNDGIGDFGQFATIGDTDVLVGGTAEDLKSLTFEPGEAEPGSDPSLGDDDSSFFDSIEASYDLNLLEFAAVLQGKTFTGVRINQNASSVNDPNPGTDGTADNDLIDLQGLRDYDDNQFTLNGGAGNDIIKGGLQGDVINGGAGDDVVFYADNEDTIRGGDGNDSVRYGLHSFAAEDNDIPDDDVEFVRGTRLHDVIDLTNNTNDVTIIGLGGDDELTGGSGNDIIYGDDTAGRFGNIGNGSAVVHDDIRRSGLDGGDVIKGNGGNDEIHGGGQNDLVYGGDGDDHIHGDDGMDHLFGEAGDDDIFGDAGDDHLDGGTGSDDLSGGEGDDTLVGGGGGTDDLDGDAGNDTADFRATLGPVEVDLAAGAVVADGNGGSGTIDDVQNVLGSETAVNNLYGDGADNILRGGALNDTLVGRDGNDTLIGKDGDDLLGEFGPGASGDFRANSPESLGGTFERGDDLLLGGLGNDSLRGGLGDDRIAGDGDLNDERPNSVWVIGKTDFVFDGISYNTDPEIGTVTREIVLEPGGNDVIEGDGWYDSGGSIVHLDSGNDVINGNSGIDRLYASDATDPFDGDGNNAAAASDRDILNGDAGDDILFGHAGIDDLYGDQDDPAMDNPLGGGGDDTLFGLLGEDFLFGGNGTDTLVGGLGVDILIGGTGGTFDGNDILQLEASGGDLVDMVAEAGSTDEDRFRITEGDGGVVPIGAERTALTQELLGNAGNIITDFAQGVDDRDFTNISESGLTDSLGSPLYIDVNLFSATFP